MWFIFFSSKYTYIIYNILRLFLQFTVMLNNEDENIWEILFSFLGYWDTLNRKTSKQKLSSFL